MRRFYEARTGITSGDAVFRELLLPKDEPVVEALKYFSRPSWALCSFRVGRVPEDQAELELCEDAMTMMTVLGSSTSSRVHRYDRVVIVQQGEQDSLESTIKFFSRWIPRLLEESRLFTTRLTQSQESLTDEGVTSCLGAAEPVE